MRKLGKKIIYLMERPLTGFLFYFICISFFLLVPPVGAAAIPFYLTLPFVLLILIHLNMSFIATLFRGFIISEKRKKNHALEHGTIYFIRKKFGNKYPVGGSAAPDGFRICGVSKKEALRKAFEQFQKEHSNGNSSLIILRGCGSNIITAQGFGLLLLTLSAIAVKIFQPDKFIILVILGLNVLLYFSLRTNFGNLIQEKLFMSLNFSKARIHSINRVKKKTWCERNPVYFVHTIIE